MNYRDAISLLRKFLASDEVVQHFGDTAITEPWPDCSPIISEVNPSLPKNGFGHQSGVYFLCSDNFEIYYIGKATKNNLHEEVWGKIKTPTVSSDEKRTYPKNYFRKKALNKNAIDDVTSGKIRIGVLTMDNQILASLAEVYLQSVFYTKSSNMLPKLNSQIG